MPEKQNCPVCGTPCTIEGNVTKNYVPVWKKNMDKLHTIILEDLKRHNICDDCGTLSIIAKTIECCILQSGYTRLKDIHLCHCRNDEEGAMTVKRLNDDFHQCPRCGGLLPLNKRKLSREKIKECIDKFWIEWEAESNQLYSGDLSTAIVETDLWE